MGHRIKPSDTAFVASQGQRRERVDDKRHLEFIRSLPCVIQVKMCFGDTQAHHIRYADLRYGKRDLGRERADDWHTVPLCLFHHDLLHSSGEKNFWRKFKINPIPLAMALYLYSGEEKLALEMLKRHGSP